jgi:hypothetical protein
MAHSIQDYLRKINSRLSLFDCVAIASAALLVAVIAIYLHVEKAGSRLPVVYQGVSQEVLGAAADSRPFGSKKGTTYTYAWCSGAALIKDANKIYFRDADEAEAAGRTFSKLCNK